MIGWYHSHPHITVHPSHVDVGTQASYQLLDKDFVGLIFSVFNQDVATKASRIQMTAFQSQDSSHVASTIASAVGDDQDPQYLPLSPSKAEAAPAALELSDSMRLDAQVLAAIRASKAEAEAGTNSLVRRDVPISIVECANEVERTSSMQDLVAVQRTLFLEEQQAFGSSGSVGGEGEGLMDGSWTQGLISLNRSLAYQQALCRLISTVLLPSIDCLKMQQWQAEVQARQMKEFGEGLASQAVKSKSNEQAEELIVPDSLI